MDTPSLRSLTRKERAEQTRQRILDAAVDRFTRYPYDQVSTTELAKLANVAHGLLFHHFQNKKNLYLESMREIARQLTEVHHISDTNPTDRPRERALEMFTGHLEYMAKRQDLARSIIAGRLGSDAEAREIFEADRWQISRWILEMVELDVDNTAIEIMMRAAAGATDTATLHWINSGCVYASSTLAEALLEVLVSCLESAQRLDMMLDVSHAAAVLRGEA